MSFSAADDLKERVREATDIVALLGSYLQLIPRGRNFVALCPFHDDSRPSLQVNPERQTWKCWPCDKGGDIFSFVMERENVEFPEAVRILAENAGIESKPSGSRAAPGSADDKTTLFQAMAWAERQFHRCLMEGANAAAAREYLSARGIRKDSLDRYQIGFAPNEWNWLSDRAKSTPYSPHVLEALGLVIRNDSGRVYDRFRGRVMFPIRDTRDRPIAVGGRILPEYQDEKSAKYINSPETRLYSKSEQLYALNLGRADLEKQRKRNEPRNVIVVEGYTDVVMASQEGIEAPVAVCGTALGAKHINVLKRYADRVTLLLDGDAAGQRRAAEVLELFVAGQIELRIVTLPDGMDPCEFVLKRGAAALRELIDGSPDALDYCVSRATAGIDLANDTQRANVAMQEILSTMAQAPRLKQDTETALRIREQQTLSRLARLFRVDEPLLRQQLTSLRAKARTNLMRFEGSASELTNPVALDGWEKELFTLLIRTPDAVASVIEKISPADMRTELGRQLLSTYQRLEIGGEVTEYQRVMGSVEDPRIKNVLVELADEVDRSQPQDPELQLRELLAAFAHRREQSQRRQQMAELQSGKLEEQEELELLNKLFESKKLES